jgi:hypothetical protein
MPKRPKYIGGCIDCEREIRKLPTKLRRKERSKVALLCRLARAARRRINGCDNDLANLLFDAEYAVRIHWNLAR